LPQAPANRDGQIESPHLDRVENMPGTPSLQQTVADEFSLHRFSSRERMIVEAIIGCLDSRDYLDASFDELRLILPAEHPFDDSEIKHVLGRI
jgi:DNA-directed RNA polymerase specialized sigma54-like protein